MFDTLRYRFKVWTGYRFDHWARIVMYDECVKLLKSIDSPSLDAFEVSGDIRKEIGARFKSYTQRQYPEFDICKHVPDRAFDIVIANQVFEHVAHPHQAGKNVYAMLKPGGYFLIMTPFMVRIHEQPLDCTRWSPAGMRYFLSECGFAYENIRSSGWGNRACVIANLKIWQEFGWGFFRSLKNDPEFPVVVWALARK